MRGAQPIPTWLDILINTSKDMLGFSLTNIGNNIPTIQAHNTEVQDINNSTVFRDCTNLFIPVAANSVWFIHLFLRYFALSANPGLKFQWTLPAAADIFFSQHTSDSEYQTWDTTWVIQTQAQNRLMQMQFLYRGAAAAGNVQLQFAQNVATAENTTITQNSLILAHQIS